LPSRYAKPEVQISLDNASGETNHGHVITISLERAQEIEAETEPIRELVDQVFEEHERNRNASGSHSVEASAERVD
jgi:hypothetical protein